MCERDAVPPDAELPFGASTRKFIIREPPQQPFGNIQSPLGGGGVGGGVGVDAGDALGGGGGTRTRTDGALALPEDELELEVC